MILKDGVRWEDMHPSMWMVRAVIDPITREVFGRDAVCTSARRERGPGGSSLHVYGRALDVRTIDQPDDLQRQYAETVALALGGDFDVVLEGPAATDPRYRDRVAHLHIEYDPE